MKRAIILTLFAAACGSVEQGTVAAPDFDEDGYAVELHPIVETTCATLDCHGVDGRPLRLYGEIGLRAADDLRDTPMTMEELAANVHAFEGVDPEAPSPEESLIILKPLGVEGGGLEHAGGTLFLRGDATYRCFIGWLTDSLADPATSAACAEAREAAALPPECCP